MRNGDWKESPMPERTSTSFTFSFFGVKKIEDNYVIMLMADKISFIRATVEPDPGLSSRGPADYDYRDYTGLVNINQKDLIEDHYKSQTRKF